jgi:hypothetical protein
LTGGPGTAVPGPGYRWIALSNTTLGTLMATINGSITLIALPDIFRGIGVNPLPRQWPGRIAASPQATTRPAGILAFLLATIGAAEPSAGLAPNRPGYWQPVAEVAACRDNDARPGGDRWRQAPSGL